MPLFCQYLGRRLISLLLPCLASLMFCLPSGMSLCAEWQMVGPSATHTSVPAIEALERSLAVRAAYTSR